MKRCFLVQYWHKWIALTFQQSREKCVVKHVPLPTHLKIFVSLWLSNVSTRLRSYGAQGHKFFRGSSCWDWIWGVSFVEHWDFQGGGGGLNCQDTQAGVCACGSSFEGFCSLHIHMVFHTYHFILLKLLIYCYSLQSLAGRWCSINTCSQYCR